MSRKENDFLKRLLVTFQGEADERLRSLAAGLIELEKVAGSEGQAAVVEVVFREVHSLKGAARSVNLSEIESICQAMEDVFAALKRQQIRPSLPLLDTLHQATDLLQSLLATINPDQPASQDKARHMPLIRQLKELAKQSARAGDSGDMGGIASGSGLAPSATVPPSPISPAPTLSVSLPVSISQPSTAQPAPSSAPFPMPPQAPLTSLLPSAPAPTVVTAETVRIAIARLEALMLQAEELVGVKLATGQRATELHEIQSMADQWHRRWNKMYQVMRTISRSLEMTDKQNGKGGDRPDGLGHGTGNGNKQNGYFGEWQKLKTQLSLLLEFLEWNHTWVEQMDTRLKAVSDAAKRDQRTVGGMIDHLLQDVKQILMLPFSSISEIFPSTVREIARQQAKEVQIVIRGDKLEVDRRILQEIKDPLMHLVRNCIDHGIELPDVREQRQKPRQGTITLTVAQKDSGKFEIVVRDDGAGIDLVKVRTMATKMGLISAESAERMSDDETKSLIFQSGFSTSPMITDLSGRGLGLAIVQEKIEKLGGVITLETAPMQGAKFHLLLPLTMTTLRGLLVRSEGQALILPLTHVERVARLSRSEIQSVQNRETIQLAGQTFSLVRLGQPLELPIKSVTHELSDRLLVVILSAGEKRIAFWVDEIAGEQEVLMKGLGAQLARARNIAGAAVLGNGQVIPIINVSDLIKSAIRMIDVSATTVDAAPTKERHILIVEDSITARMQLKNILELNGYHVKTAVDGLDALMTLRSEDFDLIVSDVDMPRLNGLDLTSRIRNDKNLAELPVILVTTLASREDQERGIDAGANAYITKSNFDQNKLLDAIRRLI